MINLIYARRFYELKTDVDVEVDGVIYTIPVDLEYKVEFDEDGSISKLYIETMYDSDTNERIEAAKLYTKTFSRLLDKLERHAYEKFSQEEVSNEPEYYNH